MIDCYQCVEEGWLLPDDDCSFVNNGLAIVGRGIVR